MTARIAEGPEGRGARCLPQIPTTAVEREMRRQAAVQDAQVLRERGAADDLDDLVQWSSTHIEVED